MSKKSLFSGIEEIVEVSDPVTVQGKLRNENKKNGDMIPISLQVSKSIHDQFLKVMFEKFGIMGTTPSIRFLENAIVNDLIQVKNKK